jgi:hypothetical protein
VGEGEQLGDAVVVDPEDLEELLLVETDTAFEDLLPCGGDRVGHRLCPGPFGSCGHGASMFVVGRVDPLQSAARLRRPDAMYVTRASGSLGRVFGRETTRVELAAERWAE